MSELVRDLLLVAHHMANFVGAVRYHTDLDSYIDDGYTIHEVTIWYPGATGQRQKYTRKI